MIVQNKLISHTQRASGVDIHWEDIGSSFVHDANAVMVLPLLKQNDLNLRLVELLRGFTVDTNVLAAVLIKLHIHVEEFVQFYKLRILITGI